MPFEICFSCYLSDAGYTKSDLNRMPIFSAAFCLSFTITSVTAFPYDPELLSHEILLFFSSSGFYFLYRQKQHIV